MGDYDTISNLLGIDTSTAKTLMDQSIKSGELSLTSQELANAAQQMSNQMSSLELGDYINSRSISGSSGGSGGGTDKEIENEEDELSKGKNPVNTEAFSILDSYYRQLKNKKAMESVAAQLMNLGKVSAEDYDKWLDARGY